VKARASDPARSATFVFKGTVEKVRAATMPSVPVDDKTLVVHVDEILRASDALASLAGHAITVQATEPRAPRRGEQAIFYATGWLFGDGIAVRSLAHGDVRDRAESTGDPVRAKAARDLDAHLRDADLVLTGRVVSVRSPAGRSTAQKGPISEHAPAWREAVIDVHDVRKGAGALKQVVVTFPSSTDVRWADVPKLQPGQEGLFLLHAVDTSGAAGRRYAVLHREDFRPLDPSDPRATPRSRKRSR